MGLTEPRPQQAAATGWIAEHQARVAVAGVIFVVLMALSWGLGAGAARAAVTPGVAVTFSQSPIIANGVSTTTVTATVGDSGGNPVVGDSITFSSSDTGDTFAAVTGATDVNGQYATMLTSSTKAGQVTITADDTTSNLTNTALLAQIPGPAHAAAVAVNPNPIVANGTSTSTATATVTDINGNPVSGDAVTFRSSDPGDQVSTTSPGLAPGTYTATITSSTTVGAPTITATDSSVTPSVVSPGVTLTQTTGTPAPLSVTLSPAAIPADGISTSVATATVTDLQGHPLTNEIVTFLSTDGGEKIGPTVNNNNGTYSATITSSTTVGNATITANDITSGLVSPPVTLAQTGIASTTILTTAPSTAVTNQTITIIATVTTGSGSPAGAMTFEQAGIPITGCAIVPVVPAGPSIPVVTVACQATFAAVTSPDQLTAVFTPAPGSDASGSTSAPVTLSVGPDTTTTTLAASNTNPTAGSKVTYTATVTPARSGHATPSGAVEFLDGTATIGGCAAQPTGASGGSVTASCSVTYAAAGTHTISARYLGDANFTRSTSAVAEVGVHKKTGAAPRRLTSTMQWTFFYTPSYTKILELVVDQVPLGANVLISCHGSGCPFASHTYALLKRTVCTPKSKGKCVVKTPSSTVNLQPAFRNRRLHVGTKLTINVLRSGWIGKHYVFTILSRGPPRTQIACLAPGSNRPGVGC